MNRSVVARSAACIAAAALAALISAARGATPSDPASALKGEVNVRTFGAVGDGTADDTAAFERAIAAAEPAMAIRVPPGRYRLTRTLTLSRRTLLGSEAGAWVADADSLPCILPEAVDGPAIRLAAGGGVHGLAFLYDWKGQAPHPKPPCIELAGNGPRVTDVKIHGAWDAIAADGKTNVGRTLIENCFIVDVHNIGVRILGTWDVSWINNVEVWSPGSKTFPQKGIGFLIGKNDMLLMSNCFVFTAETAYRFVEEIPGCPIKGFFWGSLSNCTADFSGIGVDVDGQHTVSLAGGTYWTHHTGLLVRGKGAKVRMSGLEMKSNSSPCVDIRGGNAVAISGCQFRREMKSFTAPTLRITGGEGTVITGCILSSTSSAVDVAPGLKNVVLQNNIVKENVEEEPAAPNNAP